jgi:hypothetical protein
MRPAFNEPRLGPHYARRILPDGREAVVSPLLFGRARLTVGPEGEDWVTDQW